jgi:hypothetical protein
MTLDEPIYSEKPLLVTSYLSGISKVQAVDHTLHTREAILCILKENLVMSPNRMKKQVEQHRFEHSFVVGDQLFLFPQPYKQTSLKDKTP